MNKKKKRLTKKVLNSGDNMSTDVEIIDVGSGPLPPTIEVLYLSFFKGKDDLVLVTDSGIKNEKVAISLLDGIAIAEDLKLYSSMSVSRVQCPQDQLLYKVNFYFCAIIFN